MKKLIFGRYDWAAFITYIAYAAGSVAIPVVLPELAADLNFPLKGGGMAAAGALHIGRSITMVLTMALCGYAAARWGLRKTTGPAILLMGAAISGCVAANSYITLLVLLLLAGAGEGVIEGLATPVVQQLHQDDEPERYINFTHAFWSIGVVLATIGCAAMLQFDISWRITLGIIGFAALIPAALFLIRPIKNSPLDRAERKSGNAVNKDIWKIVSTPRFWFYFCAIFFAGGGEWCLTFWTNSYIRLELGGKALAGGAATALFAFGMIFGRMLSGVLISRKYLMKLLILCGVCGMLTGTAVPFLNGMLPVFSIIFLLGIFTGPFWPSIQSVCADDLKLDSTMIYIILSCSGIPGCGLFTFFQGMAGDSAAIGFRNSFFLVPLSFAVMTILLCFAAVSRRKNSSSHS